MLLIVLGAIFCLLLLLQIEIRHASSSRQKRTQQLDVIAKKPKSSGEFMIDAEILMIMIDLR